MNSKILTIRELKITMDNIGKGNKKLVFTNGCFDILHIGHIYYLYAASKLGDVLIVGVNGDDSVKQLKGSMRPIINARERTEIIAALEMVDYVTLFDSLTCSKLLQMIKPEVYVKGGDYSSETLPEEEVVKDYGGKVEIIDRVKNRSTSQIINKVKGFDSNE